MKLTFGSEYVYDWLQLEIEWKLLYFFFDDYFPALKLAHVENGGGLARQNTKFVH